MKKLLLCTAALTMFAGSVLVLDNKNAMADTQQNGNGVQTNTYFEVDNSQNSTPAANPDNTGSELNNPDQFNVLPTKATGDLTIDAVPKQLDFGKTNENLESNKVNENLKFGEGSSYYYAQVSDFRKSHTGWNLTANMSSMNNIDPSLKGNFLQDSSITFMGNKVNGAYSNASKDGANNGVNTTSPITLTPSSGSVSMMDANNGSGSGTWLNQFNQINLNANRSDSGKYEGRITWNLTEGPGTPGQTSNNTSNSQQQ
ncbi:WxL domain-containing protein [Apilactobacillus micheneri]|uniref:WxL domain-containing protein n=1 Tax=Apilactobacillus micheneri TaxID=1899430 RepID=UPI00112ECB18|nr:WxL domain-containing protein [Apilactobacillus micheneri]TPR39143.1 WxL domain-containing protein [Apilactobacillus micheneri]TPR50665.1 WxL domain-containing protein [Apilactobacillus micheneri]